MIKKLVAGGLLGLGMLVATAAPAFADTYSGLWYRDGRACDIAALGAQATGHTGAYCWQDSVGVYELWWK